MDPVGAVLDADFVKFPYLHQLREFEQHAETDARALLWQMRTGKTKACIDLACHNARRGHIRGVIVLAPNGVHHNWVKRELPKHHWPSVPWTSISWDTETAGVNAKDETAREEYWARVKEVLRVEELPWFAFASETVTRDETRKFIRRILNMRKRVLLVVDESDDYGKPGSKKTKMVRALGKRCTMRRILTGTVIENSPLRAFSQFEILDEEALGFGKFEDFERRYAEYEVKKTRGGRRYPALVGYRNEEELSERMAAYSSVVLREDCSDLPALIPLRRDVEMTEQQKRLYSELHRGYVLDVNGKRVSVGEFTSKLIKFQQIASGYVKDEFGEVHWIGGGNPRLDALVDEVLTSPGKTIIWCVFRPDQDAVVRALRARGRKVLEYHGRTSDRDKELARMAFAPESDSDYTDLVGHPKSGGRGLDLSAASKIINYSHTFDAIVRTQADERATEMGGMNMPVVDFYAAPVDRYVVETTRGKIDVADRVGREGLREALDRLKL